MGGHWIGSRHLPFLNWKGQRVRQLFVTKGQKPKQVDYPTTSAVSLNIIQVPIINLPNRPSIIKRLLVFDSFKSGHLFRMGPIKHWHLKRQLNPANLGKGTKCYKGCIWFQHKHLVKVFYLATDKVYFVAKEFLKVDFSFWVFRFLPQEEIPIRGKSWNAKPDVISWHRWHLIFKRKDIKRVRPEWSPSKTKNFIRVCHYERWLMISNDNALDKRSAARLFLDELTEACLSIVLHTFKQQEYQIFTLL